MKQHSKKIKGKIGKEKLEQNSEQFEEIDEESLHIVKGGRGGRGGGGRGSGGRGSQSNGASVSAGTLFGFM
jgi:hypothetical protein